MKHTFIFIEIKVWTFFLSLMVCQNIVGKGSNSSSSSKQKSHIKFEEFQFGWKKKKKLNIKWTVQHSLSCCLIEGEKDYHRGRTDYTAKRSVSRKRIRQAQSQIIKNKSGTFSTTASYWKCKENLKK